VQVEESGELRERELNALLPQGFVDSLPHRVLQRFQQEAEHMLRLFGLEPLA
jgi:hypothetical protein